MSEPKFAIHGLVIGAPDAMVHVETFEVDLGVATNEFLEMALTTIQAELARRATVKS